MQRTPPAFMAGGYLHLLVQSASNPLSTSVHDGRTMEGGSRQDQSGRTVDGLRCSTIDSDSESSRILDDAVRSARLNGSHSRKVEHDVTGDALRIDIEVVGSRSISHRDDSYSL